MKKNTVSESSVVKMISYDHLKDLKASSQDFVLLDVLSPDSYNNGHIPGALSFPLSEINESNVKRLFPKESMIITYCASFQCPASTEAAKKLQAMGYNVYDYKGGLREWTDKGNELVK